MKMQNSAEPILTIQNLSHAYGGTPVLEDITFQLNPGEILCLLGPSGSGKTSLLRLISGLESNYSGSILCNGEDIRDTAPHKRGFGLMFQEYALFPHKNVAENVAFGLEMQGISSSLKWDRVTKMLDLVGLSGFENRHVNELSGGEQQRVALARSLTPEPKLLLLDEPLGSLDRNLRYRLTGEIRAILKKLHLTAVFVTHDQSEAFGIADKIAVLQEGSLQQFAPPEDLYRKPANIMVANFLGFTNIYPVRVDEEKQEVSTPFGDIKIEVPIDSGMEESHLLIRPEGAVINTPSSNSKGTDITLAGVVKRRRYQGSTYATEIEAHGHTLHFDLPLDPPPPDIDEKIHLTIMVSALQLIGK